MRRKLALSAILLLASVGPAPARNAAPDTVVKSDAHATVDEPLEAGANSFTETQVIERSARMGFSEVRELKKDEAGIWRATAIHAGKDVRVGMDYKGNVAAQ